MNGRRVFSVRASEVKRERVEWLLPGRIPFGYLTLLLGQQGLGKSQLLTWLAAANSRGEFGGSGVTLMCSAEDGWETTVKPRLEAAGAKLDMVRFLAVSFDDGGEDGLLLPDDIFELERELHDTCANLLTIDPVLAHLGSTVDSHKDASTRQALAPLARLAGTYRCATVAAHHLNKGAGSDPLSRASASVAFTAQARSVLLFARDPDDPDGEVGSRRALAHVKSNLAPQAPTQLWQIEQILLDAKGTEPAVETSMVAHIGESAHTGRDLLAAAGGGFESDQKTAVDEAKEFLMLELAGGPKLHAEVARDARGNGIADRTLQRASKDLGVEKSKEGFGKDGRWYWSLPLSIDGQGPWPSMVANGVGHLSETPHEQTVSAPSGGVENTIDGHVNEMAIYGAEEVDKALTVDQIDALGTASFDDLLDMFGAPR